VIKRGLLQWTVKPSTEKIYEEFHATQNRRHLTASAIAKSIDFIHSPRFRFFDLPTSQVMIFDESKNNRLVGIFQFTPFSTMTTEAQDNLDFLACFSHNHKGFVNPVSNFNLNCLGGKMNIIGWHKCIKPNKRIGLYLSQPKVNKNPDAFTSVGCRGHKAAVIVGQLFKELADNAFSKNHNLMVKYDMPNFGNPALKTSEGNNFLASSSISYTYNGFHNVPHCDKRDASEFAYVQWIPTFKKTSQVATHAQGFDKYCGGTARKTCSTAAS
jgi:hypothetical protein